MTKKAARLAENFRPENYNLLIEIDPVGMKFSGSVVIKGQKTGRPSERITLHQQDLKINSADITRHTKSGDEQVEITRINTHKSFDEVRLHSSGLIYPGQYTIKLEFDGNITEQLHGLYPCNYKYKGKNKKLFATQFESHHAREVFPCVDEPEAKATFDLTLVTPAGEAVLSNTPIKKQVKTDGTKLKTIFETTPRMSTYLLAFVCGEMHKFSGETKSGVEINSWATVAQPASHLEYSVKEAIAVLDFYEDYFGVEFPLKKCDQVALPDFDTLAMENWGLITYREVGLLADPINRSQSGEQLISLVIAHELSHQWFGNLVTMKWWDDLWLNESFASIIEYVCLDNLHPDWYMWEHFADADMIAASNRDVTSNVQAVKTKVDHPDELFTLFDPTIVYAKGARLIKMMYDFIGEEAIRNGLKSYFKEFAYKNTVSDDLWKHFSDSSGLDIKKFMDPWLKQSGMPLLNVQRKNKQLHFSQKRFLLDKGSDDKLWPIPLLPNKKLSETILEKPSLSIDYDSSEPVLINHSGSTHCVVHYENKNDRGNLKDMLVNRKIDSVARMNLLNDLYLLARYGEENLVDITEMIRRCENEDRDGAWQLMLRPLAIARLFVEGDETSEAAIKKIKHSLANKQFSALGWDDKNNDEPNTKALRVSLTALMLQADDDKTVKEAIKRYKNAESAGSLASEQRSLIISVAAKNNEADIDKLFKEYEATASSEVQRAIAAGLASTKDQAKIEKIIEKSIGKNGIVRPQDLATWFAYLMRNQYSRELAWNWLVESWDGLAKRFSGNKSLDRFVIYSAGTLSTPEFQHKFNDFFADKTDDVAISRPISIAEGEIKARVAWRERELPALQKYLLSYS